VHYLRAGLSQMFIEVSDGDYFFDAKTDFLLDGEILFFSFECQGLKGGMRLHWMGAPPPPPLSFSPSRFMPGCSHFKAYLLGKKPFSDRPFDE